VEKPAHPASGEGEGRRARCESPGSRGRAGSARLRPLNNAIEIGNSRFRLREGKRASSPVVFGTLAPRVLVLHLHGRHICGYLRRMRTGGLAKSSHGVHIRRGKLADVDALWELENRVFATDRMSRRSLRRLLASPSAVTMVAQAEGAIIGVAIVLFRANSRVARLYSLAVAPKYTGRGIASALLENAERIAKWRRCRSLRLEVHERNHSAIKVYRRAGYHEFGKYDHYYQDHGHALRLEKRISDDR